MPRGISHLIYTLTCVSCPNNFEAKRPWARFCIECRKGRLRIYQKTWRDANPERFHETQYRYRTRTCVQCSEAYLTSRLRKGQPFTCGPCRRDKRWETYPIKLCRLCRHPIIRRPSAWGKTRRPACTKCSGLQVQVAKEVGLTRERIRQLMEEEYRLLVRARNGTQPTRRDALENVWLARGGAATYTRLEKRSA